MTTETQYDPGALLDALQTRLCVASDAALADKLDMAAPSLSKIRHFKMPVGPTLLANASEATGIKVADLRALMGDRREKFRESGLGMGEGRGRPKRVAA